MDFPQAVWQNRIQPVLLLPAQDAHLAQVFSGCCKNRFCVTVQLFLGISQMDHGHETEHHSLIPVGQIVQHFLGFFSLLFHVVRKDSGKVIGCVLLSLPVR